MSALLLTIVILLFGNADNCQPGTLVLFEDLSYRILENNDMLDGAVCNLHTGSPFEFTQVSYGNGHVTIAHVQYTYGLPFPESAINEHYRYPVKLLLSIR